MSETYAATRDHYEPGHYEIRVRGHLDARWTDWFGGLTLTLKANGDTLLTGLVVDQAALPGVLRKVRDLGLPLLAVIRVESAQTDASALKQRMEAHCLAR